MKSSHLLREGLHSKVYLSRLYSHTSLLQLSSLSLFLLPFPIIRRLREADTRREHGAGREELAPGVLRPAAVRRLSAAAGERGGCHGLWGSMAPRLLRLPQVQVRSAGAGAQL